MKRCVSGLIAVVLFAAAVSHAREAKPFMVKRQGNKEIVFEKDHFTVTFTTGWVSKKDSLLQKIFSSPKKLTADATASGTYFDGDMLKNAWVVENTDISHDLDRPWGIANTDLLSGIPADTVIATFTIKMAAYKEDTFRNLIGAFKGAQPTSPPAGFSLTVEPYLTYASIADSIFSTLFGTDKTTYPFLLESGILDNSVKTDKGMLEHYIVAIAPNTDGDDWLRNLDATKLTFDEGSATLKYDGQPVKDHTFAVISVTGAPPTDIEKMLFNSKAAWAVLALSDFYNAPLPDINAKEDVPRFDKAMVPLLAACVDQLKRELRFSAYDRATALLAFANRSKKMILAACAAKGIADTDCKTPQIDNFANGINDIFGIQHPDTKKLIRPAADKLNKQLNENEKIKLKLQ